MARPIFYDPVILEPEDELRLDGSRVKDAVEDEGCPGFDNQCGTAFIVAVTPSSSSGVLAATVRMVEKGGPGDDPDVGPYSLQGHHSGPGDY